MRTATYDEARQWLKDKPRRMKANPKSFYTHSVAHYENEGCKHNGCLPVDATVETHDGVTTDGHGKLLGGQGSEPRNDEPFHGCRLCAECGLPIMPNAPSKQFNLKGKEICYTCFEKPTPPPAPAPVPHWICEKCGKLEPSQVENGDVCRVCGGAVMWFEPVASAPEGTPVERWPRLTEAERIALRTALARLGPTGAHELEELVERLCTLLDEKEKQVKIEDSFRKQWMEDALEQRTRADELGKQLDAIAADLGSTDMANRKLVMYPEADMRAYGITVAIAGLKSDQKERDQLRRDLAAAREELENLQASGIHSCHDKCQRPLCKMRRELDAARDRERKLREALEWYANQGSFVDECGVKVKVECDTTIARSALAATKEGPTTQQEQPL